MSSLFIDILKNNFKVAMMVKVQFFSLCFKFCRCCCHCGVIASVIVRVFKRFSMLLRWSLKPANIASEIPLKNYAKSHGTQEAKEAAICEKMLQKVTYCVCSGYLVVKMQSCR